MDVQEKEVRECATKGINRRPEVLWALRGVEEQLRCGWAQIIYTPNFGHLRVLLFWSHVSITHRVTGSIISIEACILRCESSMRSCRKCQLTSPGYLSDPDKEPLARGLCNLCFQRTDAYLIVHIPRS
jgi:hypothetical protein